MRSTPEGIRQIIQELQRLSDDSETSSREGGSGRHPPRPPLNNGGTGDNFGDMEARLAKLESDMGHVKEGLKRLDDMPAQLASIKATIEHMPTIKYLSDEFDKQFRRTMMGTGVLVSIASVIIAAVTLWAKLSS